MTNNNVSDLDDTHKIFSTLASGVSVLGLTGLVLSLLINGLIFRIWGLNFFEIASPADLVMSGANTISVITILTLIIVLFSLAYSRFLSYIDRSQLPARHRYRNKMLRDFYPFVYLMAMIGLAALAHPKIDSLFPTYTATHEERGILEYAPLAELFLYTVWIHFAIGKQDSIFFNKVKRYTRNPVVVIIVISSLIVAHTVTIALEDVPNWYVIRSDANCSKPLAVVWLGTDAVVARCGDLSSPSYVGSNFLIFTRSDVLIRSIGDGKNAQTH
jgi:hypothetical protein